MANTNDTESPISAEIVSYRKMIDHARAEAEERLKAAGAHFRDNAPNQQSVVDDRAESGTWAARVRK